MKTIVILRDRPPLRPLTYAIDHYALRWREAGYHVIDHIGLGDIPNADLVFVHIDLSVIPQEYIEFIKKIPNTVNGQIFDISRRSFSQILLSQNDPYSGRVIVKTDANYGGLPESFLKKKKLYNKVFKRWSTIKALNKYRIFDSIKKVPKGVWNNNNLIVEPYLYDEENGIYSVSYYMFFGDKEISGRLTSPDEPLLKFDNCATDELIPLPDEVKQWRKDLKIDFGRFDYLEKNGKYFLIDVNKTEGGGSMNFDYPDEMDLFASGIEFYLNETNLK